MFFSSRANCLSQEFFPISPPRLLESLKQDETSRQDSSLSRLNSFRQTLSWSTCSADCTSLLTQQGQGRHGRLCPGWRHPAWRQPGRHLPTSLLVLLSCLAVPPHPVWRRVGATRGHRPYARPTSGSGHEQQTRASSSSPACRAISGPASDLHQTHLEREAPPV